jgi:Zn-finger domain-containing protein
MEPIMFLEKLFVFLKANIEWLQILQVKLAFLGFKAWLYEEGKKLVC